MVKKIFIALVGLFSITLVFSVSKSFANYTSNKEVYIESTSGNLICDVEIDNPGTYYSSSGYAYFRLIVKNYDANGNITEVPIRYTITVENQSGSLGYYKYLDESGYSSDSFESTMTTRNYTFGTSAKEEQVINIEIKSDSDVSEQIDFLTKLYCVQGTE